MTGFTPEEEGITLTEAVVAETNAKLDDLVRLADQTHILCKYDHEWIVWIDRNRPLLARLATIVIHINGLHNRHCKSASGATNVK